MKIAVVGAGAIGGVVGGYLSKAGYDVTLVDLAVDHIEAMKKDGLRIETNDGVLQIPVKAMTAEEFASDDSQEIDLVIVAVKAQHTESAVRGFMHRLHDDSVVVSMQNGLCENVISALIGEARTIGSFINLFADYLEPGLIQYGGVGSMYIGELNGQITPRLQELHQMLQHWGPAQMTENIWGYLWSKLSYGAILTATATVDETMANQLEPLEDREMFFALAREGLSVADRLGITPMGFDDWEPASLYPVDPAKEALIHQQWDKLISRLRSYKKVKSGIWRDLAVRKRKTEVPFHLGPVIEEGERLGIDMSLTKKVLAMILELEEGKRVMSPANMEELKELYHTKLKEAQQACNQTPLR